MFKSHFMPTFLYNELVLRKQIKARSGRRSIETDKLLCVGEGGEIA